MSKQPAYSAAFLRFAREEADRPHLTRDKAGMLAEIAAIARKSSARPVDGAMPDSAIRALAQDRADLMLDRIAALRGLVTLEWLADQLGPLNGRLPMLGSACQGREALEKAIQGTVKRVTCPLWWRRQLRREVVRTGEAAAIHAGEVCARTKQPYVTRDAVRRRAARQASNAAMLQETQLEAEDGQRLTLWDAVQASTANKGVRRAELMTRIRGAEEWADGRDMAGLFTTNTLPSRFHSQGGKNPKFDGSTPREGQAWLCKTWALARAAIQRKGLDVFGFRVAEPHQDACPHWHMLLWCAPAHVEALRTIMRAAWLRTEPAWRCMVHGRKWLFTELGELETGAAEHRFKCKALDKGGAVGYVSKYIAKGIDDTGAVGAEGHTDEFNGEKSDLFGGTARLVETWAAAWGIRQFQAIGQPPVTVWRELRRVSDQAAESATPAIQAAHAAVSKGEARRACWRAYMDAQGGAMSGRGYSVRMVLDDTPRHGRYGMAEGARPVGVVDIARPAELIFSDRKEWRPLGGFDKPVYEAKAAAPAQFLLKNGTVKPNPAYVAWVAAGEARPKAAQPWTRVINCTRRGGVESLMSAGIVGALYQKGAGGHLELKPWTPKSHPQNSPHSPQPFPPQ